MRVLWKWWSVVLSGIIDGRDSVAMRCKGQVLFEVHSRSCSGVDSAGDLWAVVAGESCPPGSRCTSAASEVNMTTLDGEVG